MVARDCALAGYEAGRIHVQHVSARETVEVLERAKVEVRRKRIFAGSEGLGLSFVPGQEKAIGELAVAIFHADVATARRRRRRKGTVVWEGAAA